MPRKLRTEPKEFKGMSIYNLAKVRVDTLTTRQLRSFISESVSIAESALGSTNEQLQKSLNIVTGKTGTTTRKGVTHINKGYTRMTKSELVQRARLLQGHLGIDVFTRRAQDELEEIKQDVLDKISQKVGIDIDLSEGNDVTFLFSEIKNLYSSFGSDEVASLYEDARDSGKTGIDVLYEIFKYMESEEGKGSQKLDALSKIRDRLKEQF